MPYQTAVTIKKTLEQIEKRHLALPAIQREFVWGPEKISKLFDSLMQGYPFGTFLYWSVEPVNVPEYRFYDFVLQYHERDNPHCPSLSPMPGQQLTAVLDGQQRLTALNIALRGKAAWRPPRKHWGSDFPWKNLYLDLLWKPDKQNEEGIQYKFEFLTDIDLDRAGPDERWFPVAKILRMSETYELSEWVLRLELPQEQGIQASKALHKLHDIIHNKLLVVSYLEEEQELNKVLQIFVRTNSGGTVLSNSDLLLSTAVSQWTHHNAREEVHDLVEALNQIGDGFSFSKDLVLKAGLMLSEIGVGFKLENFKRDNMASFDNNWEAIERALMLTVQLIANFGFNAQNLTAHNAILPIAYYVYKKNHGEFYLTHSSFEQDRRAVWDWLVRSLLKSGVWGSGLDALLTSLRGVIRDGYGDSFPVDRIRSAMAQRGKSLLFDDEELDGLVDAQYGDKLTFALLSLLFSFVDHQHNRFDVDHIFPRAFFTDRRLRDGNVRADLIGEFMQRRDRLANLQLLAHDLHLEKGTKMPREWLEQVFPDPAKARQHEDLHLLGGIPDSMADFLDFYEARRDRLKDRLAGLLGRAPAITSQNEIVTQSTGENE